MSRTHATALLAFSIVTLAGRLASAASLLPVRLDELASDAESIVVGTVADQESAFNDARTLILTETTVDVEETIAGPEASRLVVSEYGGQVGDVQLVVPGGPRFRKGERLLLFLCRDALGLLRTCGATQGRFALLDGRAVGAAAGGPIDAPLEELRAEVLRLRGGGR